MIKLKSLLFEQETTNKKLNVLFVGDSQTANKNSYAYQLINSGVITGKVVAKVGANMNQIYRLFNSSYAAGVYDIVTILGGNNDAGNTKFDQVSFENIINIATDNKSKVILITCPTMQYINKQLYPKSYPAANAIAEWQSTLQDDNTFIIDAHDLLHNPAYFAKDGLHLNNAANAAIVQAWLNIVNKFEPAKVLLRKTKPKSSYKFGDTGNDIKQIQLNLIKLNYSCGPEADDGIFGPHTLEAIKLFQKNNKLKETGIVDINMIKLLKSDNAIKNTETQNSDVTDTNNTPITVSVNATTTEVINFFINKGLTKNQSIGITANLQAESGLKTGAVGDSGTSMGLAQWHANRKDNLITWTTENKYKPDSVEGQLEFLWHELNTTEKNALMKIKATTSIDDAAKAFCIYFERPANALARAEERSSIAQSINTQINNIA